MKREEHQEDALFLLNLWFRTGKALHMVDAKETVLNLLEEFNQRFNNGKELQYEFQILNGANELKRFLKSKLKNNKNFNEKRLDNICSDQLFVGELLNDFIVDLFNE